jgi:hypothetical protein
VIAALPLNPPPARELVQATEYHLALSRTRLRAGTAVIQLSNRGEDPHDLRIRGRRGGIRETVPGGLGQWRTRLKPGRYVLYCSLPGHEKLGMRAVLTVR